MTVVSSKDFATNHEMYFNMAVDEQVVVKKGNYNFYLICEPIINENVPEQVVLKPDDDLRRAITANELLSGIYEDIHTFFATK